ncbi:MULTISPECIES: FAD-dependent oxidoreductase [Methylobacterium]|uniref:Nitrite reductase [NAD(P)H] n=4 Tax=Pseudomonadota TaxID=1224 RepID=A0ABQ4SQQ7_9HYPH|nr:MULTISPECIES: FAD-dependent oxidoreductase [Methylobacterium]PIU04744.1 MAG: assimilatory nitrite reductase large subunit [Methylobacterium sp. CG09_land_8_20_14_0_10_71_15]PIU13446.1 MAG: assimilatory nitrite reductase large subunit [Methylobacterium sp. CG08_land_8_20_14_0_20_71_15]GBU17664.1 NADH:flavorubredoxin oxidoreductase [Methylobacterium sp.]GJE04840.1 Nitrite reductase [NAD(P)H] [Methylobacterium jeotgali]
MTATGTGPAGARERLVVVGNGMASLRFLERVTEDAPGLYDVTVVGAEPVAAYNRVLLSSLLGGEVDEAACAFRGLDWYASHGIRLLTGAPVTAIDRENGLAVVGETHVLPFDKLVLAVGSTPIRLPKPGMDLPGILTFRDLADVSAIRKAAREHARAVVIGGGLLGLEAAVGLARLGVDTTLLHVMDRLMERQLDHAAADLVRRAMEARGVRVILNADTAAVEGDGRAERLRLTDGTVIPADLVVVSVGVRPSVALAQGAGLATGRGILVDDTMATSDPRIFALGECAEHRGMVYGLVEPAYEQAEVLAKHLAGHEARYAGTALSTSLKVSGLPVFSAGVVDTPESAEAVVMSDAGAGLYRKLLIEDGRLIGAVFVGDIAEQALCKALIRSGEPVAEMRDDLMFGRPAEAGTSQPLAA